MEKIGNTKAEVEDISETSELEELKTDETPNQIKIIENEIPIKINEHNYRFQLQFQL